MGLDRALGNCTQLKRPLKKALLLKRTDYLSDSVLLSLARRGCGGARRARDWRSKNISASARQRRGGEMVAETFSGGPIHKFGVVS